MTGHQTLQSTIDKSVNFVTPAGDGGMFEARYVRRSDDYFIVYLSSHSGCNKACRMCHLTTTRQTMMREATLDDYINQAELVLAHYDRIVASGQQPRATRINFNWMARGEPLANGNLKEGWTALRILLNVRARQRECWPCHHISTIMPAGYGLEDGMYWLSSFGLDSVRIYYSVYAVDPHFRKRWLPKAMPVRKAMNALADWQWRTGGEVVLHGPFIKGENDGISDVHDICHEVELSGLDVKRFNHVAYNPPNEKSCEALPETVEKLLTEFNQLGIPTQSVPRVGLDVKASCGMFVNQAEGETR